MGRYVYKEKGNINWSWKFAFAEQCSNLGAVLELLSEMSNDICVKRYAGEDGEYVELHGTKSELTRALGKLHDELTSCPVCGEEACTTYTKELLADLKKEITNAEAEEIEALWFVEY